MTVIESGAGWWHVAVGTSEGHPDLYALSGPSEVVESGGLGSFAVSEEEHKFLSDNHITILSPAVYFISTTEGYHSSNNALIGMCDSCRSSRCKTDVFSGATALLEGVALEGSALSSGYRICFRATHTARTVWSSGYLTHHRRLSHRSR